MKKPRFEGEGSFEIRGKMVDWVVHYVTTQDRCPECAESHHVQEDPPQYKMPHFGNTHTHGLDKHNQREICIVLDIGAECACGILNQCGMRVLFGETVFTEGIRRDVLQNDYDVKFITFDNDPTLYMILPDSKNRFPDNPFCDFPYSMQEIYAKIISDDKGYV